LDYFGVQKQLLFWSLENSQKTKEQHSHSRALAEKFPGEGQRKLK